MFLRFSDFISKHLEKIVLILAIALSIASFAYYYHAGLITAYGDSKGHLNITRRVVEGLTPGAAQFGGYWLPLLHILMLPTIWNDFMWQSGLSGAIPSMLAFLLTVVYMYKLVFYVTNNKFSAFIAASIIMLNGNLLYMQVAPMTESLFVMTTVAFIYFFYRWFQEKRLSDLVFAALFLILCSLNRYEGWGLVIAANTLMMWYWIQTKFDRKVEGAMFAFASLSFLGIFLWLLWGAVIFHDPLEFMHNALSAGSQTAVVHANWTGLYDLDKAIMANIYALLHTSGALLVGVTLIGLIIFLYQKKFAFYKSENLILLLLIVPMLFDILTVYTGKVPIEVPELSTIAPPGNSFNIRYALYTLPFIAVFVSAMSRKKIIQTGILLLVLVNYWFVNFYKSNNLIVLKGAGVSGGYEQEKNETAEWFKKNYDHGLVLASTGSGDGFMLETGIDQKNFITEGAYKYWDESLKDPAKYATWALYSKNNQRDAFYKNVDKEALFKDFEIVKQDGNFMILKRIEEE